VLAPVRWWARALVQWQGQRLRSRVPSHLKSIVSLAVVGSMYPYAKALTGQRSMTGSCAESMGFMVFFTAVLSLFTMYSGECPLCRIQRKNTFHH
jgi:hypothetical protein